MILVDTHVLIWAILDSKRLSPLARKLLTNDSRPLYISAASGWEIAMKYRAGKSPQLAQLLHDFTGKLRAAGYSFLSVTIDHSLLGGSFSMDHKDPFDRLIAAQASIEKMPLLSADRTLDAFPIQRIW